MIEITRFEDIIQIRMKSEVDGAAQYWVSAYLVDGLLIDTGCIHTAEELGRFLESRRIHLVMNTHHHEDHVGANHLIQKRFRVDIWGGRRN